MKHFREECSAIGGTNEGSCASGFGVCCVGKKGLACNSLQILKKGVNLKLSEVFIRRLKTWM